jgi:hypothetical protein
VWWWVLIWTVAVLGSLALFAFLGVRLFRQGMALGAELEIAATRFGSVAERLDELGRAFTPEPSAVFEDPATVRARQAARNRHGRHRKTIR